MKIDFEGARLYVRPGSTDLRKGVTGLLAIIENEMHLDALSNSVFFFCNFRWNYCKKQRYKWYQIFKKSNRQFSCIFPK